MVFAEHFVTLFDASIQRAVPATTGVVSPLRVRKESASVLTVTPLVPFGVKMALPEALKNLSFKTRTSPLNVEVPETNKLLLIVVVPVDAPRLSDVAAPPILRVVAVVLNKLAVV